MKVKYRTGLCLLALTILTGCEIKGPVPDSDTEFTEEIDYIALYQEEPTNDLLSTTWNREELKNADSFMSFTEYLPDIIPSRENTEERYNHGFYADTDHMYVLETYYRLDEHGKFFGTNYLNIIDTLTREVSYIKFSGDHFLQNLHVAGGRYFAVNQHNDETGNIDEYRIVELKKDGTIEAMADVSHILTEYQMAPKPYYVAECSLYYDPISKLSYLFGPSEDVLYLVEESGRLQSIFHGFSEDSKGKVSFLSYLPSGKPLLLWQENSQSTIFYLEGEEPHILYDGVSGSESVADKMMVDPHGHLLFSKNGSEIVDWNTASGEMNRLYYDFVPNASTNYCSEPDILSRNENGEILILRDNALKIITEKGPAKEVTFTLKPFYYYDSSLETLLKTYECTHPGVHFNVEKASEYSMRDKELSLALTQIGQGEGPDILLLHREEMMDFSKNDALLDLTDFLSKETTSKLVQGFVDAGSVDGRLKMLSTGPYLTTYFVNKKYCGDSPWTVKKIVDIIKQREQEGNPLEGICTDNENPFSIFMYCIESSDFVDLTNNTCNFNCDLFIELLNLSKKYTNPSLVTWNASENFKLLKEDKVLMCKCNETSLSGFSKYAAALGEDYLPIGNPSNSGEGNLLEFYNGFAINKNTQNLDVLQDFLNWYYSMECLTGCYGVPLRMDALAGKVRDANNPGNNYDSPYIRIDAHSIIPLEGKSDGTSFLPEYTKLITSCKAQNSSGHVNTIYRIIMEETSSFFDGKRSAEETAKIIDSRVSIYLQENN